MVCVKSILGKKTSLSLFHSILDRTQFKICYKILKKLNFLVPFKKQKLLQDIKQEKEDYDG